MALLGLFVLPLVYAQQHLPPEEKLEAQGLQKDQLTLLFSEELLIPGERWAEEFRLEISPDMPVTVQSVEDFENLEESTGVLAILAASDLRRHKSGESRIFCLGREVTVPVVHSGHPFLESLRQTGIPTDAVKKEQILVDGNPLNIRLLAGKGQLEAFLKTETTDLAFCLLADVTDETSNALVAGAELIPVDRNGNGTIDFPENYQGDLQALERAVWMGKYPGELCAGLYAMTDDRQLSMAELAFIDWMTSRGRNAMAQSGITGITESERYSLMEKAASLPVSSPVVIPYSTKRANGWLPYVSLVVVIGIFLLPLLFFRKAPAGETPVTDDAASSTNGEWTEPVPGGLYFDRSHTWAFMEKDGTVRVGIDRFLPLLTGPVSRVEVAESGVKIGRGEPLLTLIRNGKRLQVKSPVSGEVLELNPRLKEDPALLNRDPFANGWICTLKPAHWTRDIRYYFMADYYRSWIQAEVTRLKEFFTRGITLAGNTGTVAVLQDGGEPKPGILDSQKPEIWEEFQNRFIDNDD